MLVHRLQPLALLPQRSVDAAGLLGDLAQHLLVESRLDDRPVFVAQELTGLARHRNQLALRRPDTDGVDAQAVLRRAARRFERPPLQIFPIGQQHQELVVAWLGRERVPRLADRPRQVRTAPRDDPRLQRRQRLAKYLAIERQRALQEGVPGERDQPDPVAVEFLDQVAHRQLGPRQAVRFHVLRQHAPRGVDREEQVDSLPVGLLPVEAELRAGQRDAQARHPAQQKRPLQPPPPWGERRGELGDQVM